MQASLVLMSLTANFDDYDEADEETNVSVNKEYDDAEKNDEEPYGKPGSLINRMIMHGNKKTEEQIASESTTSGGRTAGTTTTAGQTTSSST